MNHMPENIDPEVPPMTRAEMNELLEREGLSVRLREEPKEEEAVSVEFKQHEGRLVRTGNDERVRLPSIFSSYHKVETVRGPSRDRSLSGKARRKARKAG